jgi:hypothetical protein
VTGRWFSPGTPVSSINKTDRHEKKRNIVEIGIKHQNTNKPSQTALSLLTSLWQQPSSGTWLKIFTNRLVSYRNTNCSLVKKKKTNLGDKQILPQGQLHVVYVGFHLSNQLEAPRSL